MTNAPVRRIKPGVPRTLKDLNAAVGKAGRTVFDLGHSSPPEAFDAAADELYAAFVIARDLARPNNVTGCADHPQGAVDTRAPDGWGRCLVCNTHRRRAERPDHAEQATEVRKAGRLPAPRPYATTSPEYAKAAAKLSYLPDMGGASIEAARVQLGPDARYEELVLHAAAHPVIPAAPLELDVPNPRTDTPTCDCGTALDPDGSCLTCASGSAS